MRSRDTLTTTVDKELKQLFEDTRSLHNFNFGDLMDKAIRDLMITLNQVPIIDQEIARKDAEMAKIAQERASLGIVKERLKDIKIPIIDTKNNGRDEGLEIRRNELFEKSKDSILKLWMKNDINWDRILPTYEFQNTTEAREWFGRKIEELKKL